MTASNLKKVPDLILADTQPRHFHNPAELSALRILLHKIEMVR